MASPGAPNKAALDYFPKMVNFYEDDKIFDLLDEYGPLGVTIYDCILTIVYSNGYFTNLSKDKLSRMVIRKIGNKWIKNQKVVVQVIDYCADLGLLHKDLMLQNVITSVGIQKRYYKIAVRLMKRRLYSAEYWLLDENGEPLLNSPIMPISSEEKQINSEENNHSSEETRQKEKERKRKEISIIGNTELSPKVWDVVQEFILYRKEIKAPMTEHAVKLLIGQLQKLSSDPDEQIEILRQSIVNGWKGIFSLKKSGKESQKKPNQFHNFNQRNTDYDSMVLDSVKGWISEEEQHEQECD